MSGLREFLNEYFNFRHIAREKRKYKQQEERAEALPDDYRHVYRSMQQYLWGNSWRYAGVDGMGVMALFADLLELLETAAAEGKPVLAVTGEDVAAFCDELLQNTQTSTGKHREALNRDIRNKLGQRNGA